MFTGLIEDIGTIQRVSSGAGDHRVTVSCHFDTSELVLGESVAVDGACYTVVDFSPGLFVFEASPESLERTTLGAREPGDEVHLERAMVLGGRLGGHLVLGHVDGVGTVTSVVRDANAWRISVEAPVEVSRYLVPKGSITINGVSLTVNGVEGSSFDVAVVPFTASKTLLTGLEVGDRVNLEADIIGKYVARLVGVSENEGGEAEAGVSLETLRRHGFA